MTKLPKSLEALRDNIKIDETRWAGNVKQSFFNQGFDDGATAVLESEELKDLTLNLNKIIKSKNGCITCDCDYIEQENDYWQHYRNKDCIYHDFKEAVERWQKFVGQSHE